MVVRCLPPAGRGRGRAEKCSWPRSDLMRAMALIGVSGSPVWLACSGCSNTAQGVADAIKAISRTAAKATSATQEQRAVRIATQVLRDHKASQKLVNHLTVQPS